ncbi:MAG: Xylose isomerase-like TIM barrel [Firmicutes bacterium ADurb.Bin300]|nr:MAG: Xylose isomerase-like TIM barrel [Firmicutes bacterium ADurb.Bin300]
MKLGVCFSARQTGRIAIAKEAGFDYVEVSISEMSDMSRKEIDIFKQALGDNGIPCEAANCFIKGENKVVGKTVDYNAIIEYLHKVLPIAFDIGIKTIVFGSGGSRNREDDFPEDEAYRQVTAFLRDYAGPECAKYGVRIAVEPLVHWASKMIHTVEEAVCLSQDCALDNVKALADLFHMYENGDDVANILKYNNQIIHSHIANPPKRRFPLRADEFDYKSFLDNLKSVGCERCSIESGTDDFEADAKAAFKVLNSLR